MVVEIRLWNQFVSIVANDDQFLVLRRFQDLLRLAIFDQDSKLERSVLPPNDFLGPFHALQKINREFVVSHNVEESYGRCISFLSPDRHIISHWRPKEAVGFNDVQMFLDGENHQNFAVEMLSGNV